MSAAVLDELDDDTLTLVGLVSLAEGAVGLGRLRGWTTALSEQGLFEPWGNAVLRAALEGLTRRGLVHDQGEAYGDLMWSVEPGLRPTVLPTLHRRFPDRLRAAALAVDDGNARYSADWTDRARRFLLALASQNPARLTAAGALVDHALAVRRTPGDFEYSVRTGRLLGMAARHALATGQWSSQPAARRAGLLEILGCHTVMTGAGDPTLFEALGDREGQALSALVAGDLGLVRRLAPVDRPTVTLRGAGIVARYLSGDAPGARGDLERLLADLSAGPGSKKEPFVPGPLFPWLAALALAWDLAPVSRIRSWTEDRWPVMGPAALVLWAAFRHRGKADALGLFEADLAKGGGWHPVDQLLIVLGQGWNGLGAEPGDRPFAEAFRFYQETGARWYQREWAAAAVRLVSPPGAWAGTLEALDQNTGIAGGFGALVGEGRGWEESLRRLADLKFDKGPTNEAPEVLCWLVDPELVTADPCLRRPLRSGGWSAPKRAPVTKLVKGGHPAATPEDGPALRVLATLADGWATDDSRLVEVLAGHPRLFLASDESPLTLEASEIELRVDETPAGLTLGFSEPLESDRARLIPVGPAHWRVLTVTDKLKKVAAVVGTGLTVPAEARDKVIEVLGALAAGIQVRSPLLKENRRAVEVTADPRPVVVLTPHGTGLALEVHVRPLGPGTPLLRPGEGPALVHAARGEALLTGSRDLRAEASSWRLALAECPDLDAGLGGGFSLGLPGVADALSVLAELRDLGDRAVVEWPLGGRIGLAAKVSRGALRLKLTEDRQWFAVTGQVQVDEGRVADFQQLMAGGRPDRFIALADGDWIEIEAQLLRQLQNLAAAADPSSPKHPRVARPVLASSELLLDAAVTLAPEAVDQWRQKWALRPDDPVPASLTAELRPYQLEGFRWLARLADLEMGACLADDMGLGKTVQTIALLAHRADRGPSLVLAPTSVASNWVAEIRRFDRRLEPVLLGGGSRDQRAALVSSLGPGQVLVATYGLLVTEEEALTGREWNVAVLDEAQAVKNLQAKRTQSALGLRARFRVAVTGTPLQNHLGELWTLFEFLNPGLLGTRSGFQTRFWGPVEDGDETVRRGLQALVRPYLLRRTKNQVLAELPPRTETTLAVDLTPGEREFYEALRRQAVEALSRLAQKPRGEQQILTLTHLMKLRRACCHPSLAGGPGFPSSSKLDQLEDLLAGLIDNGHRALVFSQFTDHLALIRARLAERRWACEYLDGSTPAAARADRVKAFQTGDAPVFLISLQAGGTGLNLTAADYVIHMDPWWNPAVEDQASDRAHRIGQDKPVTVYRLVARDTIEEKIVALHRTKRDLADALLEGTEAVGRLGADELLALLTQG